ncbi:ankyrin repeat-containing domain protein [Mycena albidolilacea]|uniref:Ankyrin repeat-containing domain protein n=1 Tax=Mycena albidolilacea TaxID=1033008 RepID=A0AAD6ZMH3_9AGAR|nr:ankyrin repeat-containing domain protein [Mycena albidolilacea]
MPPQAGESPTATTQVIYGGMGGTGGKGGLQGGDGGTGEGPTVSYSIEAGHVTVNTILGGQQMESTERAQIIDWLSPLNFFLRQADISRTRQSGTGAWLLDDVCFQEWKSGSGTTLWCRGIPGAGKTVLVSMVVDHLDTDSEIKNICVACIYLNHKEAEDQTPGKLLSGLWRQLIFGKDVSLLAKKLYQRHQEKHTTPSPSEIFEILQPVIGEYSMVYIIVDAIDEYLEAQRRVLLDYLAKMGPTVNLMITSRPHITPDVSLPNLSTLEIHATEHDVRRYVDEQIRISSRLSKHVQTRADLREEIHLKITANVDGMFLLAKLHIESLSSKTTIKTVREALKALPKNLNDSYNEAMNRIESQNEEDRNIAHSALTWVVNAKRPLTVAELQVALAIEPDDRHLNDDSLLDIEIILSVCAGLVILDEQSNVVRLVHYTTQEYFESIQAHQFPNAQTDITRTLLTFLALDDFVDAYWHWDKHLPPLVEYSQYCLMHAAGQPEAQLRSMILNFIYRAKQWKRAVSWRWRSPPWDFWDWPSEPSALWIAAAANFLEVARILLEGTQQSYTTEISVAAYYGHLHMVQLLAEHGANVNAKSEYYGNAIQAAAYSGHKNIVQLLLNKSADVNAQGGNYGNPISAAALNGHENIVQLLLNKGANVNAQGGEYGSPIQAAAYNGHENIVQLLLNKGVDVNAQGGNYGNPISAAALNGHENIVQLLLNKGAYVNAQGGDYGSPIQAAAYNGHENIVQLLLNKGADVNAQGGNYGSPILAAALNSHENIVQLLLNKGANVNAQGGHFGSPIQAAAYSGYKNTVQLLLNKGADVNAQGGQYGSPISAAALSGHENIVQLLLDKGVDVNAQGGDYGSPIQAATYRGYENIVQLLLNKGADVNAQGGHFGSPIQAAAHNGHESIVQLLLNKGADMNAQSGHYGSPISAAALNGHENIVQLLLNKGANVNAQGGDYGSPIQAAAYSGYENIVQLLLNKGADMNAQSGHYGSPISAAALNGHENIVQLLLNKGANVNAQGGHFGSPIQAAAYSGYENIVQLLLNKGADVNAQGGEHGSALQVALLHRHKSLVQLLQDNGVVDPPICNEADEDYETNRGYKTEGAYVIASELEDE